MTRLIDHRFQGKSLVRDVFIETGTYMGETTQFAKAAGYKQIHTIEISRRLAVLAKEKFAGTNVTVHCGSSPDLLPHICDPRRETTFFLDGHYQGGPKDEMDVRYGECPLMDELDVILAIPWVAKPYIVIDDSHIFTMATGRDEHLLRWNMHPSEWPRLADIVKKIGPEYAITEQEDRLYCLPRSP